MERGSSTVDGGQSKPKVKRAKNGRTVCVTESHTHRWSQKRVTHRHKMGGARFDMSAPDIRDKPQDEITVGTKRLCRYETKLLIEWQSEI